MEGNEIIEGARAVWRTESAAVSELAENFDPHTIVALVKTFAGLGESRVFTSGAGTSGVAARKIAHTLSCVGVPTSFIVPSDSVHGALGVLRQGDWVILISKGGNTPDIVQMLPGIKGKGARLISVTENPESALGKAADILVRVEVKREPDRFNMLATASTMAVTAVFDAVACVLIDYTGYRREDFAVIHPSGAVGERLLKGEI